VSRRRAAAFALVTAGILSGCATPSPVAVRAPASAESQDRPRGGPVVPVAPPAPAVRTLGRVTLGAVGDVLMHEAVKRSAETHGQGAPDGGYAWLYAPVADLLAEPDVTFANLETPVAPRAGAGAAVREFFFNAPPAAVAALAHAGVDVVNVANNHLFDLGRAGFEETLAQLDAAGMPYVGAGPVGRAAGPTLVERNGLRIALLAYAYGYNQAGNECPPGAGTCAVGARLDREWALADVRAAAATADAVVVSLHWGKEYASQPLEEDVAFAHRLVDAGALVVLGHHPHVLQPVELHPRPDGSCAVIAYSLGNFVSNQSRFYVHGVTPLASPEQSGAPRDGVLLRVALERRDYGRGVVRVELAGADWLPLWTENDTAEIDARREPGRRPAIRVVSIDRALAAVRAGLAEFPDPVPADRRDAWARLRRREALFLARRAAIAAVVGEDLERTLGPAELAGPVGAAAPLAPGAVSRAPAPEARGSAAATPAAER